MSWARDPNFDTAVLEIDRVEVSLLNEPNDAYEPETWPDG